MRCPAKGLAGLLVVAALQTAARAETGSIRPVVAAAQAEAAPSDEVLRATYEQIKALSVHRLQADWGTVDDLFTSGLAEAATLEDKLGTFRSVFAALDDVHSTVVYRGSSYGYFRPMDGERGRRVRELYAQATARTGVVESRIVSGDVGWVLVPGFSISGQEAVDAATRELRNAVCGIADDARAGWIVDLRWNAGGHVHPMLSGLGDLIGDGVVARQIEPDGRATHEWTIRAGVLYLGDYRTTDLPPQCPGVGDGRPVAVLVGPVTMSSGQATAIAFAGRSRTTSIGEATAEGYATINQWHQITDELALNLSVAFLADRIGRVYPGVVHPERVVAGLDAPSSSLEDPVMRAAIEWIRAGAPTGPAAGGGTEGVFRDP